MFPKHLFPNIDKIIEKKILEGETGEKSINICHSIYLLLLLIFARFSSDKKFCEITFNLSDRNTTVVSDGKIQNCLTQPLTNGENHQ